MTVTARIESGVGGRAERDRGPTQSGAESFRSNLQAQLTSIAGGLDNSGTEAETLDGVSPKAAAAAEMVSSQDGSGHPAAGHSGAGHPLMMKAAPKAGPPSGLAVAANLTHPVAFGGSKGMQIQIPGLLQGPVGLANARLPSRAGSVVEDHAGQSKVARAVSAAKPQKQIEPLLLPSVTIAMPILGVPIQNIPQFQTKPERISVLSAGPINLTTKAASLSADEGATMDGAKAAIARPGLEPATPLAAHPPAVGQTHLPAASDGRAEIAPERVDDPASLRVGAPNAVQVTATTDLMAYTHAGEHAQGMIESQHSGIGQDPSQSSSGEVRAASVPVAGEGINQISTASGLAVAPSSPVPIPVQTSASPGIANHSPVTSQIGKRAARGADSTVNGSNPAQSQFASASGDAISIAHNSPGTPTTTNLAPVIAGTATLTPLRETFGALDADPAPGSVTWTHASARQAEAGFEDPALGWVRVRADMNGGGVHATVVPSSLEAAQMLAGHMDGLNAYMAAQHTTVASLAVSMPEVRDASHTLEQNLSQGMNQGPNQGTGQEGNQGGRQPAEQPGWPEPESRSQLRVPGVPGTLLAGTSVLSFGHDQVAPGQSGRGVHISVVA